MNILSGERIVGATNAGTYVIEYTVSAEGYQTVTGTVELVIDKAQNKLTIKEGSNEISSLILTYPEKAQLSYEVEIVDHSGATPAISLGGDYDFFGFNPARNEDDKGKTGTFEIVTDIIQPKSQTQYVKFVVKGTPNIEDAVAYVQIRTKLAAMTVDAKDVITTYDGNPHTFDISVKNSNKESIMDKNLSIEYSYVDETGQTVNSNEKPSFTNAGTYTVSYVITRKGYETYRGSVTVKINPRTLEKE